MVLLLYPFIPNESSRKNSQQLLQLEY